MNINQSSYEPRIRADTAHAIRVSAEALLRERRFEEAEQAYRQLVSLQDDHVQTLSNYGAVLKELGRLEEAEPVLQRAVARGPQSWAAWSNLGCVMLDRQRYEDAIAAFSNALRLNPLHVPALSGLGVTLNRRRLPTEAISFYDLAISIEPQNAITHYYRSLALLAAGDYLRGFAEHEWRQHVPGFPRYVENATHWKGEPLEGRTLLVYGEGGLGDILQFSRYIPLLRGRTGQVILRAPLSLSGIFSRLPGVDKIIGPDDAAPKFDFACSILSLPHMFQTTIDMIPFPGGYLSPSPAVLESWTRRLAADVPWTGPGTPFRVGLVWAGGSRAWNLDALLMDGRRSITLQTLAPIAAAAPGAQFYSLQLGDAGRQAANPPTHMQLIDHTSHIHDFDDTAALASLLDLVISVDTSTAHLAAALGRPVWLLSRYDQCWRWLIGRDDSPWYETVHLYTQPEPFDWATPVERMTRDIVHHLPDRRQDGRHVAELMPF